MINEKDPFNQIEKDFKPDLPQVSKETVDSIGGEFVDDPNFISDTYWRMTSEQTPLTGQIANYIGVAARDPQEALRMKEVLVLTYRALESQAQADAMNASFESEPPSTEPAE